MYLIGSNLLANVHACTSHNNYYTLYMFVALNYINKTRYMYQQKK